MLQVLSPVKEKNYPRVDKVIINLVILTSIMDPGTTKKLAIFIITVGAIMAFFPRRIEMRIYPEHVQPWKDSADVGEPLEEPGWVDFQFVTGDLFIDEGFDHRLYVTNTDSVAMNVTLWVIEDDDSLTEEGGYSGDDIWIFPPLGDPIRFLINGSAYVDDTVTVDAWLQYLRPVPSEYFWEFPYRTYGIGVAALGLVVFVYVRVGSGRDRDDQG